MFHFYNYNSVQTLTQYTFVIYSSYRLFYCDALSCTYEPVHTEDIYHKNI